MYLKSIEIHGFKSFANKILFEFHDGITAIVGPNGSGKSNVADAVRWVLGEQSAKQLRGASMQDVIFSGSEARKPLGYAYVCITFDNSDHALAIDFTEVSVARRVYRSGESEYLINGNNCRLKDVQELFMDTGIGKEGYSIIGQGQIDRILSTKPEERRELFDEAAGIVKFKKRKAVAEKELEAERLNLSRVTDIISELEKQIGPLERQSEVAKKYLEFKETLKRLELNQFILDFDRVDAQRRTLDEKLAIVNEDLASTRAAHENAKGEYEKLEKTVEDYARAIEEGRNYHSELLISIEKAEGEIRLMEQQLVTLSENEKRVAETGIAISNSINARNAERAQFVSQKAAQDEKANAARDKVTAVNGQILELRKVIEESNRSIEDANAGIIRLLSEAGSLKTDIQKNETMLEQNDIRRAELSQKLLFNKSGENELAERVQIALDRHREISTRIFDKKEEGEEANQSLKEAEKHSRDLQSEFAEAQKNFIECRTKLDSMKNLAERYEGYAGTVKKIMEVRDRYPGVCGVVADLITVEKKYETAVEVALGASIQHIVTEDEQTAKSIIEYLKKDKLGRATFLPITSVGNRRNRNDEKVYQEKGVIGDAASLVKIAKKYEGIADHLLKAFIVVDNIDNALKLANKYDYSLRIVTLEGEQLQPGGSIAGGAFKNNSNLLGRNREIAELSSELEAARGGLEAVRVRQNDAEEEIRARRKMLDTIISELQTLSIEENTLRLNLEQEQANLKEVSEKCRGYENGIRELDANAQSLKNTITKLKEKLASHSNENHDLELIIGDTGLKLTNLRTDEEKKNEELSGLKIELANLEQAASYSQENINRIDEDIKNLTLENERNLRGVEEARADKENKLAAIEEDRESITASKKKLEELEEKIETLAEEKKKISEEHKGFLEKWDSLGRRVNDLDKESFRLTGQREKLEEQIDGQTAYIWEEYKLAISGAREYRDESITNPQTNRRDINDTKSSIRDLGDVNVNAIEEYKTVSERYTLLTAQKEDIIASEARITGIIEELVAAMQSQFSERFELIKKEFNSVFRELFGGGKGELELVEDEDVLEAGIRIIAQPPGKKLQNMMQLSGGEKALTAIALLFAIQNLKPSPFCLLDEIEAALDDSNVKRFASYLKKLTKNSQFIVITHRRGTMASADILYGITMQEKGVSTLVSVNLIEGDLDK